MRWDEKLGAGVGVDTLHREVGKEAKQVHGGRAQSYFMEAQLWRKSGRDGESKNRAYSIYSLFPMQLSFPKGINPVN